jgi:hypothetical protein
LTEWIRCVSGFDRRTLHDPPIHRMIGRKE